MAVVTVLTAEKTLELVNVSVISGAIDASGHLILTKYDGSTVDAGYALVAVPDASETQKGVVEIASSSEITTGTDDTKVISALGLAPLAGRVTALENSKVLASNSITENPATIAAYPNGTSLMELATGSGWSLNSGVGLVVTHKIDSHKLRQIFHDTHGTGMWKRYFHDGFGGWGAWTTLIAPPTMPFTLATGWIDYSVDTTLKAYVRNGLCYLEGVIKFNGTTFTPAAGSANLIVNAIPANLRPTQTIQPSGRDWNFPATATSMLEVYLHASDWCLYMRPKASITVASGFWVSLSGITWPIV